MDGWALGWTKENRELFDSTPKGRCLLLFRLYNICAYILYFYPPFSLTLWRQKRFSDQFQPWHLLVQCLPQPAIHICSPHKLDPIRWHQTMAYSSTSLALRQGPWTIQKCFFFHYGASDLFKGVYPLLTCQPLFTKVGLGWGGRIGDEDNNVTGSYVADAFAVLPTYCSPKS